MRCKKCKNEVEHGKFVCDSCRKQTPSRKKDRSKKRMARKNESLAAQTKEKDTVEVKKVELDKLESMVEPKEDTAKPKEEKTSQINSQIVDEEPILKTVENTPVETKLQDDAIAVSKKSRSNTLVKGTLLFLSGVVLGVGGTLVYSHTSKNTPVIDKTVETSETSKESGKCSDKVEDTSSEQVTSETQKQTETKQTEKKEKVKVKKADTKKQSSKFSNALPDMISKEVKGLKGYYSYYLHDLSESKGKSGSNKKMLSASTIKLFILETAFSQVKEGKLDLAETYELVEEDKVSGTGNMQNAEEGTPYTNEALLTLMIVDSDNTATNIMIERLGGLEVISDYILDRGYGETVLARKMSDMEAISEGKENYTSVADVGRLMSNLASRKLIGKAEDDKMLEILSNGKNHEKLAKHIPDTMTVYCKSGEFSDFGVQNDTVLMEGPEGRYILTIMSEGGDESEQVSVMQTIGQEAYQLISKK